jgi:hypothetical protein
MYRGWINQPSSHQPLHNLHGVNVLVHEHKGLCTVYFLAGPVTSMIAPKKAISYGWRK